MRRITRQLLTFFRGPLALPSPEEDEVVDDRRAEDRDLFFKWPARFGSLFDGSLTAQWAKSRKIVCTTGCAITSKTKNQRFFFFKFLHSASQPP